ncbi:siderophore-interacting protein [Kocuria tytonis]|uniref:Siderophore-interacting protein n=1 Tax=Kocuria tytonis TaxID=2054280 RepID=A0A495ACS1_9MICC|nr:siderophore-interacting protein [Kocuria tytonis]RKQ36535.1 siderophore-interacting protein [Kocuria tytonis]
MTELACVNATVTRRERISEHLVRVRVAGEQLRRMPWGAQGPGPRADAYLKVLIPPRRGASVRVDVDDMARWRREFMAAPPERSGWMRTYTVRDAATVDLAGTPVPELAIDVVLHGDPEHGMGPGATWGDTVREGDTAQLLVPAGESPWWAAWDEHRAAAQDVVIAGDETALPAISAIVDGIDRGVHVNRPADAEFVPPRSVTVAVEVPTAGDAVPAAGPRALAAAASCGEHTVRTVLSGGTELVWTWLPRGARGRNLELELWLWDRLSERARRYWATGHTELASWQDDTEFVWNTARPEGHGTYWFLAAESAAVKSLRRMCVSGGVPKTDISFMGYWKQGAATE